MPEHLTRETIDAFGRGTLAPAALLAVDDHLASCEACRALAAADPITAAGTWQAALGRHPLVEHPSYEQWEAFVDGRTGPVDLEILQTHLAHCAMCAAEVGDLRTFKAALSVAPDSSRAGERSGFGWLVNLVKAPVFRIAAPLGAVGLATVLWVLLPRPAVSPGEVASTKPPGVETSPAVVARIQDAVGSVTLDADGRLQGLPPMTDAEGTAIRQALTDGQVPVAAMMRDVLTSRQTLMGRGDAPLGFEVVGPLAAVVESDRPEFTWKSQPGATAYVVVVYDDQFSPVVESPNLTGLSWRPTAPLARGRIYTWQVRAITPKGTVTAPRPPAPEARFAVIGVAEAERIAKLRAEVPASRLRLAVAYAQAGMLDAAEAELQALQKMNPGSPIPSTLLDRLRALRR